MNKVYPIPKEKIIIIREELLETKYGERNEFMFVFMLNIPLRISDTIKLKVSNVKDKDKLEIVPLKTIRRNKETGEITKYKKIEYLINPYLKKRIKEYVKNMSDDEYLFKGQGKDEHISRVQAWSILKNAAKKAGIKEPFGCHSTRKTNARALLDQYGDISLVMRHLGHSSESSTLRYLHLTEEKDNERISALQLY